MAAVYHNDFDAIGTSNTVPPGFVENAGVEGHRVFAASAISRSAISGTKVLLSRTGGATTIYTASGVLTDQGIRIATNYPSLVADFPNSSLVLRSDTGDGIANNSYRVCVETNGTALRLNVGIWAGGFNSLATSGYAFSPAPSDIVHFYAEMIGTTINAWLWTGATRPTTPTVTATHSAIVSGYPGMSHFSGSGNYDVIDNVVVTDGAAGHDYFYSEVADTTAPAPADPTVTLPAALCHAMGGLPLISEPGKVQFLSKTNLTAAPLANVSKTTNADGTLTPWAQAGLTSGVLVTLRWISDADGHEGYYDVTPV
jgi:hypothetical protein